MYRLTVLLTCLLLATPVLAADYGAPKQLYDLYFGEALYYAYQGEWFDAISRLDTELQQHYRLDEPQLDTLFRHIGQAQFDVGDFELAYRMHRRAGRAITAVIEGDVPESVRNAASYRLAKIYFQKDQPFNALAALERIKGEIPAELVDDLTFLRAEVLMACGRDSDAIPLLEQLKNAKGLEGFSGYNLGIAQLRDGQEKQGRQSLDLTGQLRSDDAVTRAIRDKTNLVLGDKLLAEKNFAGAKNVLDRVRLEGPFSNQALLGSGWADASQGNYDRALVPWSILSKREITDASVQEALLAVPFAYGKLGVYSKAALLYGSALQAFGTEIDKLSDSIKSIREGKFLQALSREELQQDANWVVKLRNLPGEPETYYLMELMASHDFQESLQNYLDLDQLRKRLETWRGDLDAYEELITLRRNYYQPLLPEIDGKFRQLDSQMRLRLEQRERIAQRLQNMLVAPRPDYLATAQERIARERIARLKQALKEVDVRQRPELAARIARLQGVMTWNLITEYDSRLTQAFRDLDELNQVVEKLQRQYTSFVRTRQAATQSYEGYDGTIRNQRLAIKTADEKVTALMARQGHLLEVMAVNELTRRRDRLEEFQVKARFALADSYDRAARAQGEKRMEQ